MARLDSSWMSRVDVFVDLQHEFPVRQRIGRPRNMLLVELKDESGSAPFDSQIGQDCFDQSDDVGTIRGADVVMSHLRSIPSFSRLEKIRSFPLIDKAALGQPSSKLLARGRHHDGKSHCGGAFVPPPHRPADIAIRIDNASDVSCFGRGQRQSLGLDIFPAVAPAPNMPGFTIDRAGATTKAGRDFSGRHSAPVQYQVIDFFLRPVLGHDLHYSTGATGRQSRLYERRW